MAKSTRISNWIAQATGSVKPSGKIPPAASKVTYSTEDFNHQAAPANTGGEPAGQVEVTLKGTLKNLSDIASGKIPPDPEK